jgi:oxepin-CoA hydrolase / 3-oxo-5,6-dehydrosuberyl-CoA semialdehyde dehydrogenase
MYLEDFKEGATFVSETKEVKEENIQEFARLTGDYNRLHTDPDYAKSIGFERGIVAHGLLTLSLGLGLWHSMNLTNGTVLAFLGLEKVSFMAPVYPGDRLRLFTKVSSVRESKSRKDAGLVSLKMTMKSVDDDKSVLEASLILMMKRREG